MAHARSVVALLWLCSCGSGPASGDDEPAVDADTGGFDRRELLAHLANDLAIPSHETFATAAHALHDALEVSCDDDSRAAWRDAIDRWERIDAVLIGPASLDKSGNRSAR